MFRFLSGVPRIRANRESNEPPDPVRTFGDNLRRERIARGFTQEQLAELAELNPRTIQKIEAGQITILLTTLHCLRAALGCDWRKLLG